MNTVSEIITGLRQKDFSCVELTNHYLKNIEATKDLNIFITETPKSALEAAKAVDALLTKDEGMSELAGVPYTLKDLVQYKDVKNTNASKIVENFVAPFDSTVSSMLRDQDSVMLGKVNLDEFACGSSTETSYFGTTLNPHNKDYVSGGSSGGSAAAVAANNCVFSIGTDTGGSIRQPAAFCGVYGLKPTYGRVSRYGVTAMASSWDTIGPIAKSTEDLAMVLNYISGLDKKDSTTVDIPVPDYLACLKAPLNGLRIGIPKEYFLENSMTDETRKGVMDAIEVYKSLGAEIIDVSLPKTKYALAVYYVLMPAELSTNLSRFDSIRYGSRTKKDAKDLFEHYTHSRAEGFGDEIKRRILMGTYVLSEGYFDAYYKKAQKVRTLIIDEFNEAFKNVDVLLTPVVPSTAFKVGEKATNPLEMYMADIFTIPASCAGIPAMSVPCGFGENNLPLSFQLISPQFTEERLLNVAYQYEMAVK